MVEAAPRTTEEIIALVNKILVEVFELDPVELRPQAHLVKDLDLDSLDGVDLVVALEKTFRCKIGEDEARTIGTVGDIYDRVSARLGLA